LTSQNFHKILTKVLVKLFTSSLSYCPPKNWLRNYIYNAVQHFQCCQNVEITIFTDISKKCCEILERFKLEGLNFAQSDIVHVRYLYVLNRKTAASFFWTDGSVSIRLPRFRQHPKYHEVPVCGVFKYTRVQGNL